MKRRTRGPPFTTVVTCTVPINGGAARFSCEKWVPECRRRRDPQRQLGPQQQLGRYGRTPMEWRAARPTRGCLASGKPIRADHRPLVPRRFQCRPRGQRRSRRSTVCFSCSSPFAGPLVSGDSSPALLYSAAQQKVPRCQNFMFICCLCRQLAVEAMSKNSKSCIRAATV